MPRLSRPFSIRCALFLAALSGALLGLLVRAWAADCLATDDGGIKRAIGGLSASYNDVPSCLACGTQKKPIEKLICRNQRLKLMEVLDTKAAVYAYENATGRETRHARPDCSFVAEKLATCADEQCACRALKEHTNESLGGTSPYYREAP